MPVTFFCGRFLQTAILFITLGFEDALCFSSSGVPNVFMLPVCPYLLTLLSSGAICSHTVKMEGTPPQPFIPCARWPAVHGQLHSLVPEEKHFLTHTKLPKDFFLNLYAKSYSYKQKLNSKKWWNYFCDLHHFCMVWRVGEDSLGFKAHNSVLPCAQQNSQTLQLLFSLTLKTGIRALERLGLGLSQCGWGSAFGLLKDHLHWLFQNKHFECLTVTIKSVKEGDKKAPMQSPKW